MPANQMSGLRWLFVVLAAVVAFGCGAGSKESSKTGPSASGAIEVASFEGGYGIDFFQTAAKEYEANHPGVKIKVWGSNNIWQQLQPRYVSGDVPDLCWNGWGMDEWKLIYEGQLRDLTEALDSPAADGKTKWRDTFDPKMLALGQFEGKQYRLPYHVNVLGWWYNPVLFKKRGWSPPRTWAQLLDLCAKIKAAGIAPLTYQGQYPYYMVSGFLFPWVVSVGGIEALDAMQELRPGAWKSPAVVRAATMIRELKDRGYFQDGALGLNHTQSQAEFLNGKAAMIPCGSWLYSEMRETLPSVQAKDPDMGHMAFMLPPIVEEGAGDPSAIGIGIEPWTVPAKAKNPQGGIDFFKYMTSLDKARQFVKEKGTLMAIIGANDVELPPHLVGPAGALKAAGVAWMSQYNEWYKDFGKEVENAMSALLAGELTPEQFAERCEQGAERARQDPDLVKHQIVR